MRKIPALSTIHYQRGYEREIVDTEVAMLSTRNVILILITLLSATATHAQTTGQFQTSADGKAAILQGRITDRTSSDFDALLASQPNLGLLFLDSPGGQVVGALDIARKVNALNMDTAVLAGSTCASACSIILLAGDARLVGGRLGVHQMSSDRPSDIGAVQYVIADILDAFGQFGVDARVVRQMLTTAPEDMYYFEQGELEAYAITRTSRLAVAAVEGTPSTSTAAASVSARRDGGRFADYPVQDIYRGAPAQPQYVGQYENARNFRTRISNGLAEGVNFAGNWSLIEIGCGSSCRFVMMVNTQTGEFSRFPLAGGEDNYQMELTYIAESSLVKSVWMDTTNDNFDTCVQQDFEFADGEFSLVWENRYTIESFAFCTAYQ